MTARQRSNHWLMSIFAAKAAAEGGIVRRALSDVDRIVGRARFIDEVERRGFQAFENAGQVIIFCNGQPIRRMTAPDASAPTGT